MKSKLLRLNPAYRQMGRGFTIIEVMMVLSIAGLIMGIVFLAVPQLQRSSRDNTRKNLAGRLLGSIETYASNNQGLYPFVGVNSSSWADCSLGGASLSCNDWYSNYVSGGKVNLTDPSSGSNINICYATPATATPTAGCGASHTSITAGDIYIGVGNVCNGVSFGAVPSTGTDLSKQFALLTALDKSGSWSCVDNR